MIARDDLLDALRTLLPDEEMNYLASVLMEPTRVVVTRFLQDENGGKVLNTVTDTIATEEVIYPVVD